jgi:hypothetical protein
MLEDTETKPNLIRKALIEYPNYTQKPGEEIQIDYEKFAP